MGLSITVLMELEENLEGDISICKLKSESTSHSVLKFKEKLITRIFNFMNFFLLEFLTMYTHCASPEAAKVEVVVVVVVVVLAIPVTLLLALVVLSVLTMSLISTEVRVNAEAGDIIGEDAASIDLV